MIDITNKILTKIKADIPTATVTTSFQSKPKSFPKIVVTENGNTTHSDTVDSSGEKHSELGFEINIFTKGNKKMSDAKVLRNQVDDIMSALYGMGRNFADEIPNYADTNIYRYVLRYDCLVDNSGTIYRR